MRRRKKDVVPKQLADTRKKEREGEREREKERKKERKTEKLLAAWSEGSKETDVDYYVVVE